MYKRRIVGKKTSTGTKIKGFSNHAFMRLAERRVSPNRIEQILAQKPELDKKHPSRDVYKHNGIGVVVDRNTGEIVTVMMTKKRGV